MKQRDGKKKISSLLLVAAMMITSFPVSVTEVYAAEPQGTAAVGFATKEQLMTFNTNDEDGSVNPAKVYFGKNNGKDQEWWIAGSQSRNSVTLFAASPLGAEQKFDSNYNSGDSSTATKSYESGWGSYSGTAPSDVNANHYGGSTLRTALKELVTSCFSEAEQALMQATTIYTNDTKNSTDSAKTNCAYSTTDKLYLAYGKANEQYITVGKNASADLNSGLRIENGYWGSQSFWLRAPHETFNNKAWEANQGARVVDVAHSGVENGYAVVPAFELNLSSVLFASAARAASSDSAESKTIASGTAMILRLDGKDKTIGTAIYDVAADKIVAQKAVGAADVSLVVQAAAGITACRWERIRLSQKNR